MSPMSFFVLLLPDQEASLFLLSMFLFHISVMQTVTCQPNSSDTDCQQQKRGCYDMHRAVLSDCCHIARVVITFLELQGELYSEFHLKR